jgi:hypothetical protein
MDILFQPRFFPPKIFVTIQGNILSFATQKSPLTPESAASMPPPLHPSYGSYASTTTACPNFGLPRGCPRCCEITGAAAVMDEL